MPDNDNASEDKKKDKPYTLPFEPPVPNGFDPLSSPGLVASARANHIIAQSMIVTARGHALEAAAKIVAAQVSLSTAGGPPLSDQDITSEVARYASIFEMWIRRG